MENICRLCTTSSSSLKSAFSLTNGRLVVDLVTIICPWIKIDKFDGLPENICFPCLKTLKDAVELRETSVQSDQKLRSKASRANEIPEVVKIKVEDGGNSIFFEKEDDYDEPEVSESDEEFTEEITAYEPKAKRAKIGHFKCSQTRCRMRFISKNELDEHFRLAHQEKVHLSLRGNMPVECTMCGLVLAHRTNLSRHIKRRHDPNLPFECAQCNYRFEKEITLKAHLTKEHQQEKPAKNRESKYCEECEEPFESENDLMQHLKDIHKTTDGRSFNCEYCEHTFTMKHNLTRHYRTVHQDQLTHECKICFQKFKNEDYLARHEMRMHGGGDQAGEEVCSICRQSFNGSKYRFERHMIAMHAADVDGGIYECDKCGKRFIYRRSLRGHLVKHRRREAERRLKFKCDGCSRRFESEEKMERHGSFAHKTPNSNFVCYICGQIFSGTSKTRFEIHMKRHAGILDFQCHQCPQKYASARDLDRHLTTHSDLRPFECTISNCKMTFKSRDVCRKHMKRHQMKLEKII